MKKADRKANALQEFFVSKLIQDHFDALSKAFGFAFDVYFSPGGPSDVLRGASALCSRLQTASTAWQHRCEAECPVMAAGTQTKESPTIFTCYAKMINFVVPVRWGKDQVMITGRGAFSSPREYREYAGLVKSRDSSDIPLVVPPVFVGKKLAWNVSNYVSHSVKRLFECSQDASAMRTKFETIKKAFGQGDESTDDQAGEQYRSLVEKLFILFDLGCVTVLTLDPRQGRYTSRTSLKLRNAKALVQSIGKNDSIVKGLLSGKPCIRYRVPSASVLHGPRTWHFFPIFVNGTLESILALSDRMLKDDDILVISELCKHTAFLTENRRLQQDLNKKVYRLAFASTLPEAITNSHDCRAILQMILDKSAELLMAEKGSLMLVDRMTDMLLVEARKGSGNGIPEKLTISKGEGIAGKVAALGEPLLVRNLEEDPRFRQKNKKSYKTSSFVCVPLKIEDRIIGVLNLSDKTTGEVFDDEDLKLIQTFATHAAIVLDRNALFTQTEELKQLSITDPLTGLLNRRYIQDRLEDELARSERYDRNLCVLMIDLDGFKYVNDTFGHRAGDEILKCTAGEILRAVRTMDVVSRYGGDEFIVLLPETDLELATKIAARLNNDLEKNVASTIGSLKWPETRITASIGIVSYPQHGRTGEQLLDNADKAMYRAKQDGKNRCQVL
jgi:diguanylate cyclase (GGDEF)-like protein